MYPAPRKCWALVSAWNKKIRWKMWGQPSSTSPQTGILNYENKTPGKRGCQERGATGGANVEHTLANPFWTSISTSSVAHGNVSLFQLLTLWTILWNFFKTLEEDLAPQAPQPVSAGVRGQSAIIHRTGWWPNAHAGWRRETEVWFRPFFRNC